MKVAWILYGDLEQRTGGTIYDAQVIEGLRRAGDDVHVFSLRADGPVLGQSRRLARDLRELRADVVVGDELCFRELAIVFRVLRARKVLLVHHWTAWEEERPSVERRIARIWERATLAAADHVIATSETTRARLRGEEGARRPIEVVRPGADRLCVAPRADGAIGFLFLGSVTARKRVLPLVAAVPPAASLTVIGSLAREPGYVARVRAAAGPQVAFRGELSDDDVSTQLAAAGALVMPSSLEGYGIAATEALWAGVPVLAARAPGLVEALAPFADASLLFDDHTLAPTLRAFAETPTLRASLREGAESAKRRLPTWSQSVASFRASLRARMR